MSSAPVTAIHGCEFTKDTNHGVKPTSGSVLIRHGQGLEFTEVAYVGREGNMLPTRRGLWQTTGTGGSGGDDKKWGAGSGIIVGRGPPGANTDSIDHAVATVGS